MKTFFARNPEWNEVPRKWTITIVLDDIPQELQNPSRASDPESLFPTSLLERQMLSLEEEDGLYMLKAKAGPASLAVEPMPKPTSSGETTRAVITIVRQREQYARTILVERRKLLDRETQPWIPTSALNMSSLSADAPFAETNGRAGDTGQRPAVDGAGTPLEHTDQAIDPEDVDRTEGTTGSKKRSHRFVINNAKRQRIEELQELPAPAQTLTTTNTSDSNGNEVLSTVPNVTSLQVSFLTQLLAGIRARTAELGEDIEAGQEILHEINTRGLELARDIMQYEEFERVVRTQVPNHGTLRQRTPWLSAMMARIAELFPRLR